MARPMIIGKRGYTMDISNLWTLQVMMFFLVAAGAVLKSTGILKDDAKGILTDLVLYFFLPCNIINSFRMEFNLEILKKFAVVLGISLAVQFVSYTLSKLLYNHVPKELKRVMQYCTIVSNSGFLGLPIAQGIYGAEGMMYASVFIIPMRVMMWSAGIACFTESPDMKSVVKKLVFHPCIVAVYIGLGLMIFQNPLNQIYSAVLGCGIPLLPELVKVLIGALDKGIRSAGGCTTAMTMVLIGMMFSGMSLRSMIDKNTMFISALRLVVMPAIVFAACHFTGIDPFLAGVCTIITGMPAGSTSAILAAKYGCDYKFATKCIVISTLLSLVSIPIWAMLLG